MHFGFTSIEYFSNKTLKYVDCNCAKGGRGCDDFGKCYCKPNIIGKRCERCAPGSYDYENGCKGINVM